MKLPTSLLAAAVLALPMGGRAQTTLLNDSFGSDTLNPAIYGSPTSTSTDWNTIGNKTTVTSDLSSGLTLSTASTGSVIEAAALFTNSPITLSASGDYVKLTYTFSGTGLPTSKAYVLTGLFNSGGTNPLTGLTNYTSGAVAGGVAGWTGYNTGIGAEADSSSSKMFARPAQLDSTANNQDLLYGGLGTAYGTPVQLSATNSTRTALVDSTVYTLSYMISLDGSLNPVVSYDLYTGSSATGTAILSNSGTQSSGTVTTTFDALAIGFYNKNAAATTINYSNVSVSTNVSAVPEPSTYAALAGIGVLGLAFWRRRRVAA